MMRLLAAIVLSLLRLAVATETGNHPEWPRWCGKAYQPQFPSFDPGGQTVEPPPLAGGPALHLQFKTRYSIYLESETHAEVVVKAQVSQWHGQPWPGLENSSREASPVHFTIRLASNGQVLVSGKLAAGSKPGIFPFSLSGLKPSLEPYTLLLSGTPASSDDKDKDEDAASAKVTATGELLFLPEKRTGSVTKLDNLDGGMLFRSSATGGAFTPFLPYGFYASCDNFLCDKDNRVNKIAAYRDLGLNSMVSLTTIQDSRPAYELLDRLDLRFMYDLRGSYKNLTAVREQVSAIKDFDAIYSYWGSDEPDGHQDPFNLVVEAKNAIRAIDPYHPISVTLNCQNYHFAEYTAGADLIMEDAYPIAINATFSKWGTPCNATYGDCGCDNCRGDVGDVSRRLDDLARYERWLGLWPKTKAHNPQSFHGEGYWLRDPTPDEEVAMVALAFHHGAKAIASWVWPTSDLLAATHGGFARVVATSPIRDIIVRGRVQAVPIKGYEFLDVAYWNVDQTHQILLSVVYSGSEPINGPVTISLPKYLGSMTKDQIIWGPGAWKVGNDGIQLGGIAAMSTNMIVLRTRY